MKKIVVLGLVLLLVASSTGFSQNIPLPKDIEIKAPSPGLPKEIAAFSGKWKGKWEGKVDFILVVTEIDSQKAKIIYATSESKLLTSQGVWSDDPAYCIYEKGEIVSSRGKFQIQFQGKARQAGDSVISPWFNFEMQKDLKSIKGILEYKFPWTQYTFKSTLEKIE